MHNHTNHYSVNDDNANMKSGGREEEEMEYIRQRLNLVILNNVATGRENVQFNFDQLH